MKFVMGILMLVASIFLAVGVNMARNQDHKIRYWPPVKATIVSSVVEQHVHRSKNGTSVTYEPVIRYSYSDGKRTREAGGVLPLMESSSSGWAHGILNQFPVGQEVTAYVNPENGGEGFLLRRYSVSPYVMITFASMFLAIGLYVMVAAGARKARPPTPVLRGQWYELKPTVRIAGKRVGSWLSAALWIGAGAAAWGHFFSASGAPYPAAALWVAAIAAGLAVIPIGMAVYFTLLSQVVGDAQVFIPSTTLGRGTTVKIAIHQPIRTSVQLEESQVGLRCEVTTKTRRGSKTTYSTSTCYDRLVPALQTQAVRAGQSLEYALELAVPDGTPGTTPGNSYPRYCWLLVIRTRLANSPDYRADFPVVVV